MKCKRCGVTLKAINYRHVDFCNRMPLPRKLAEEYVDSGRTYTDLAEKYNCSINAIRSRVLEGLKLLDESPRPVGRPPTSAGPCATAVNDEPQERCNCGIILTDATQQQRGTCDYCAGLGFDYMQFRRDETAVAKAIPVSVSLSI